MDSDTNSTQLWVVRLLFVVPMLILFFYTLSFLSRPDLITSTGQVSVLFGILVLIGIVLVLASQITIPWTDLEEKHAEYFIEELEEQEKVLVIPTACPRCKTAIEMNRVRWGDEYTFHCSECQAEIKLRIIDK